MRKDSAQKTASCGFEVQVKDAVPPVLNRDEVCRVRRQHHGRVLAHVCGRCGRQPDRRSAPPCRYFWLPPVDSPISYPNQLRSLMSARYTTQTITTINEGKWRRVDSDGRRRPRASSGGLPRGAAPGEAPTTWTPSSSAPIPRRTSVVVTNLRNMISPCARTGRGGLRRGAERRSVRACAATPPCGLPRSMTRIRTMVAGEDATLVDLYKAFGGQATTDSAGRDGRPPLRRRLSGHRPDVFRRDQTST